MTAEEAGMVPEGADVNADGADVNADGTDMTADPRRIGVYVCHCGGNISDYVDIDQVVAAAQAEPGVVVARQMMFACSDSGQGEMERDIEEQQLDGMVVASCSPKLHVTTFRGVAKRAGLNPYEYTQVNVREQASWIHAEDAQGTTDKAVQLVKAGVARTRLTEPLEPLVVETTPRTLVIGGGVAGLRAAIGLADIGLGVFLVEREPVLGGRVGTLEEMYPTGKNGKALIADLLAQIRERPAIRMFTEAEMISKTGSFGNYQVGIQVGGSNPETLTVEVGSIVVTTGVDTYTPEIGEYGYGIDGVVTLPELKAMIDASSGRLTHNGRPVGTIAYIYCVGSREPAGEPGANEFCSRYCCAATVAASVQLSSRDAKLHQYHLYRDMRTYGKFETMYTESRELGSVYLKFGPEAPPAVTQREGGGLLVTVKDLLTGPEELAIPADLVVLVTGMVPRRNEELINILKLPVDKDGFFNEIHPKLRPVETMVDGVFIAGACQGPKNSSESVASGLAAVTQSAVILKKGFAELDPLVAIVHADACTGCGECVSACPYAAIEMGTVGDRAVALISETGCKGCGGCVPVCPENAIDLRGYTDAQITAAIDKLLEVTLV
jgi:heterodisulfide reductase subunit A2